MAKITIKQKILKYVYDNPDCTPKNAYDNLNLRISSTRVYFLRLRDDKLLNSTDYGKYKITDKGIEELKKREEKTNFIWQRVKDMQPEVERIHEKVETMQPVVENQVDLEVIDIMLKLKIKYGREKLLQIINKVRKLIE